MANIGAYSRHKMLEELNSPLYSSTVGGNTYFLTPQQQKQEVLDNIGQGFTSGAGTVGTNVTAAEYMGLDGRRTTRLTLTAVSLGNGGDGADLGIGALIYTFPAGDVVLHGEAHMKGAFSSTGAYTNTLDAGVGSVIASGAVNVLSGTATFEDLIGGTTTAQLDAGGAVVASQSSTGSVPNRLIAAAGAHTLHLNAAGSWTNIAAASPVLFTGTVEFTWQVV